MKQILWNFQVGLIKPFLKSLGIEAKDMVEVYGGIFNIKAEEAKNRKS